MIPIEKICGRLSNKMFEFAALYAYCRDNNYPIFVQDEKYFKKYEAEIRKLFGDGIDQRNKGYVGIHVRRAKNPINPQEPAYSDNPFYENLSHHTHEDMSDNYYVKAMNYFREKGYNKFIVYSDDIKWCMEDTLLFKNCLFYHESEIEDLNDMASCEHNIIANSSFSWWAAYLNPNPNKIVVAPKQWFADPANEKFIGIPKEWIRI
jgi:hypothetical protein